MVDPVRNGPNAGSLAVHDQKKSNVSSGQERSRLSNCKAETSSVSVDLSMKKLVL